jgi:predicted RNA-binding protein
MIITNERYIITTKEVPNQYEADNRKIKFISDDKITFYRMGDLVTNIEDAYKWEEEDDAKKYLEDNFQSPEEFEVRLLKSTYEVM